MNVPRPTTLSPATLDDPEALAQVIYYRMHISTTTGGTITQPPSYELLPASSRDKYLSLARDIADQRRRFAPSPPEDTPEILLSRTEMQSWVMDELAISALVARAFVDKFHPLIQPYVNVHVAALKATDKITRAYELQATMQAEGEQMAQVASFIRPVNPEAAVTLSVIATLVAADAARLKEALGEC